MTDIRKDYPEHYKAEKGSRMVCALNHLAVTIAKADGNAHPHRELCDALHAVVGLINETIITVANHEAKHAQMLYARKPPEPGENDQLTAPNAIDVENTMGWLNLSDGEWDHLLGDTQDKLVEAYKRTKHVEPAPTKLEIEQDKIDTFVKAFDQWSYQYQVAANCSTEDLPVHRDILATRMKTLLAARAALKD